VQILSDNGENNSESTCLPCALFAVVDNGLGMDESVRAHLFEPFFTTKVGKGTGIGLAVCRRVVNRHGGKIWVESEPGQGSTFHFTIPEGTEQTDAH